MTTKYEALEKENPENFNVFNILQLGTNEVRLHSRLLAELLNPKGTHKQSDTFLKIFVKDILKWNEFTTEHATVVVEHFVGHKNNDESEGGYLDILIEDKLNSKCIIIENKIYAYDQYNQMLRYYNYGKNNYTKADGNDFKLIYLTLDGRQPSDYSKSSILNTNDFYCHSYQTTIINWLELCEIEMKDNTLVLSILTHYKNHVKYLTNQTINKKMEQEIINEIKFSKENFINASNISKSYHAIRIEIYNKIRAHYYSFIERNNFAKYWEMEQGKIIICIDADSQDGYFVGLSFEQKKTNPDYLNYLIKVSNEMDCKRRNENFFTWYNLKCIEYDLNIMEDDKIFNLLNEESLQNLYLEIDNEINNFLITFKSKLETQLH